MALLGTLLETARYTVCANHAIRTLGTSTEALLTEYSRPLYDNYGLFFIENNGTSFENVIANYAGDTMECGRSGTMNFFQGEIRKISVTNKVFAGENKGDPIQQEINQYMLRTLTKKQFKKWLGNSKELQKTEEKAEEIETMVEEEKEAAELDQQLLELMRLIDGISVSGGKVSCEKTFIKMFVTKDKKSTSFGITEPLVWKKMKSNLDETPLNFDKKPGNAFRKKVKKVLGLIDKAQKRERELQKGYKKISGKTEEFADYNKRMKQFMGSLSVLEHNREILEKTDALMSDEWTSQVQGELENLWKDYDTDSIVFDYTGVEEKGGGKNPLDELSQSFSKGMISLVYEQPSKISKKETQKSDVYRKLYKEDEKEKNYENRVTDLAKEEKVELSGVLGDMGSYSMDEFCLDSYIADRFSSFTEDIDGWKKTLDYQWEYIIAGKNSDVENLNAVLNRILLLRTVANFAAIYKDEAKKTEAYGAAAAIVGFSGMEPLIRLTQTLILLVWSMVESMVDVAGILQARHVPVVKKPSQVLTTFPEIFIITGKAITKRAKKFKKAGKTSFGYRDYIMLFLAATKQSTRRYRLMDLIEWDMRKNGYNRFQFGNCVFSMQVEGVFSFPTKFFRFSTIEEMLDRQGQEYQYCVSLTRGYL